MIKLDKSQIAQILPGYLSDMTEVKCLSFAINRAVQKFVNYCRDIGVYAMIDSAPDEVLNFLAVELDTQYYDTSFSVEIKRELIKNTLVWYLKAGTPSAVAELIAAVFGEGKVQEWFEYGGEPFYFKILTNATLTPDGIAQIIAMIARVKNARSHIETISVTRQIDQRLFAGCATQSHISNVILEGYTDQAFHNISVNSGTSAIQSWTRNTIN